MTAERIIQLGITAIAAFCIWLLFREWFLIFLESNSFTGVATLLSAAAIFGVYWQQKRNQRADAARTLLMEIRNAENTIAEIRRNNAVSEASFILPANSWQQFQHFFVRDLDNDELLLLNNFYNTCVLAQKELDRMKNFLPFSNEEKIKLTQQKLLELAEKYKGEQDPRDANSQYTSDKKAILESIFYPEADWFMPTLPQTRLIKYLENTPLISTSSCGTKLKRIAKLQ